MSKATFVSLKRPSVADSNSVFLSECLDEVINIIAFLSVNLCNMFICVHAKCAHYKQVITLGLNHRILVQLNNVCGGKYW
jgi:hypothetical protein